MNKKQLWTELSDGQAEKLVGGHPPGGNEFGPFGSEPALNGIMHANAKAIDGIVQGYVTHAPTCLGHPGRSH